MKFKNLLKSFFNNKKKNYIRERDKYNLIQLIGIWKYLIGYKILDIGYKGYGEKNSKILPWAKGIDKDSKYYNDKLQLNFPENSIDGIFACHVFEHLEDPIVIIKDWFKVLKQNKYLVLVLPSLYWYERKRSPSSAFNSDHKNFYSPASILHLIEKNLNPLEYKIELLKDNIKGKYINNSKYDYENQLKFYEFILIIKKIKKPFFQIEEKIVENKKIYFDNKSTGFSYCDSSFHPPENFGVWSSNLTAKLKFNQKIGLSVKNIILKVICPNNYNLKNDFSIGSQYFKNMMINHENNIIIIKTSQIEINSIEKYFDIKLINKKLIEPENPKDNRKLGVGLKYIIFSNSNEYPYHKKEKISPNIKYYFNSNKIKNFFDITGFSNQEDWGTWIIDNVGTIVFKKDIKFEIKKIYIQYNKPSNKFNFNELDILIDNKKYDYNLSEKFIILNDLIKTNKNNQEIKIDFKYKSEMISASDDHIHDKRKIQLGIKNILFYE